MAKNIRLKKNSPLYARAAQSRKAGTATTGAPGISFVDNIKPVNLKEKANLKPKSSGPTQESKKRNEIQKVLNKKGLSRELKPGQTISDYQAAYNKFSNTTSDQARANRAAQGAQPNTNAPSLGRPSSSGTSTGRTTEGGQKGVASTTAEGAAGMIAAPGTEFDALPDSPLDAGADVATYAEIGEANIQADFDANIAAELGLTGEAEGFTSLDELYKAQYDQLKEGTELSKEQLDLQRTQLEEQVSGARNAQENQVAGAVDLVGGREGVTSGSNVTAYSRAQEAASTQISRLFRDRDASVKAITNAQGNLDAALKAGSTELASKYRQQLLAAESAAQATETAYVNALTLASEEERNQQAAEIANFGAFTNMVDTGTEMSVEAISNFANQLGVDFDSAYNYYAGSQSIRDDKSLDQATKEIELAQLQQEFSDELAGLGSEEAKAIDDYMTLVQSGNYTEDELTSFAVNMDIPDSRNPVFQAELAVSQAEAKIKGAEAKGEIVNPKDQVEYATALQEYYDLVGINPGTVPSGGSVETTAVPSGGGIRFNFENGSSISSGSRALTECGQFVNDVLGTSMGDDYSTKFAYVDKDIRFPEPGMGFTYATNQPYGHTGIVEYFNAATGMVGVADVNGLGDNKARHREVPLSQILDTGGFVPGNGEPLTSGEQAFIQLDQDDRAKFDKELRSTDEYKSLDKAKISYDALVAFEDAFNAADKNILGLNFAGKDAAELSSKYNTALLQLKEYFNLGVLNGPDLEIMQQLIPDPTSPNFKTIIQGGGSSVTQGINNIKEQLGGSITDRYNSIQSIYGGYGSSQLSSLQNVDNVYNALSADLGIQPEEAEEEEPEENPYATYFTPVEETLDGIK